MGLLCCVVVHLFVQREHSPAANSKDRDQAFGPLVWATLAPEDQQEQLEAQLIPISTCQEIRE